jgi:four helix bundle protein
MSRDHSKLKVFGIADDLVVAVYRATTTFPKEERYGLVSQLRRAATSVPTNIVEGCARRTTREYVHFLETALASGSELRYLLDLSHRLGFLSNTDRDALDINCATLLRSLQRLIDSLGS